MKMVCTTICGLCWKIYGTWNSFWGDDKNSIERWPKWECHRKELPIRSEKEKKLLWKMDVHSFKRQKEFEIRSINKHRERGRMQSLASISLIFRQNDIGSSNALRRIGPFLLNFTWAERNILTLWRMQRPVTKCRKCFMDFNKMCG